MLFYNLLFTSTPCTTLNYAFGGPNHDDSVHADAPTAPQPTELFHNMLVIPSNTQVVIILSCCGEIMLVTHEVGQKWPWCVTSRSKHGVCPQ